jgi:GntR family transcriptional regulator
VLKDKIIDKSISIPYYYQLKLILEDYLVSEHPGPDEPFPTEESLSALFGISRPTVRQAINELVVEGRLTRTKGKGTFLSKPKINQEFTLRIENYLDEMRQKGMTPKTDVLKCVIVSADARVANALRMAIGDEVIELHRLRYANDEPIIIVVTFLPYRKCPEMMNVDYVNNSLYNTLAKKYGYEVERIERSMEGMLPNDHEAAILKIEKCSPLIYFESIAYLKDNTPIEYSRAKYRGDRSRFFFKLAR